MNGKNSHTCISLLAFSMPMIALIITLAIGLAWGQKKEGSEGKKPQAQASHGTEKGQ